MKLNFRQRLFLYFCLLFSLYTGIVLLIEYNSSKQYKTEILEERLDSYATVINKALANSVNEDDIEKLVTLFPSDLRLTLLNNEGTVIYDNLFKNHPLTENHFERPEIDKARKKGKGRDIRISTTNDLSYLYYAKKFGANYIRVALPYNIEVKKSLRSNTPFFYLIIILFAIALYTTHLLSNRFSKSIKQLRDFAKDEKLLGSSKFKPFPNDELGEVATQVVENYKQLHESKSKIILEREKLLQHIHSSKEGLCFFTSTNEVEFHNGLYMQYLNILLERKSFDPKAILVDPLFSEMHQFIQEDLTLPYWESKINKQGKQFSLRVNRFEDQSFEVILNDVTEQEKTQQLKKEMTSNIAHELRTPITSIRGYLETIHSLDLPKEQTLYFIDKAYKQTINLSELIDDMSIITKIEEASTAFEFESVALVHLIKEVVKDLEEPLKNSEIEVEINLTANCIIKGNRSLIYSVFRNLIENTIKHGGKKADITIQLYNQDKEFYYISFADKGVGIKEEAHLNRLFERFYRVSAGRARTSGGSGLGLSIVKNAIQVHQGTITAKRSTNGGLEFLFKLKK